MDMMTRKGIASIAILPSGSISGHFVDSLTSQCLGLYGTQISCERECSRGEDYKLINLSILEFSGLRHFLRLGRKFTMRFWTIVFSFVDNGDHRNGSNQD